MERKRGKTMKRSNEGITLGALVVTIIVLLILVGVSLNLVAGSNGIMNRTTKAVDTHEIARMKEEIEMLISELQMDYYSDYANQSGMTMKEYVESKLQEGVKSSTGAIISCDKENKIKYNNKEVGTLEIDCTVTMNGEIGGSNEPEEPTKPLATEVIKPENYGDSVNYSANHVNDWKVFLNDGSNVYLIASDYVPNNGMTITSDVAKVAGNDYCVYGNSRDGFVGWLTSTENWSAYAAGMDGATATGGPTLQQFWASYNGKYGTSYSEEYETLSSHIGYSSTLYFPHTSIWNGTEVYWLASPNSSYASNIECVTYYGSVYHGSYNGNNNFGIRPLVCLPAGVKAQKSGSTWVFSN